MAMSGLARSLQGVTDWSAKMTNGLPVTKGKLASVSSHATVPVLSGEGAQLEIDLI
jgi:hypothetical protein